MYLARLFLLGLQKELPRPVVNQTTNGMTTGALGLHALGRCSSNMYLASLFLLGLQKELPRPVVNQTTNGMTTGALGLHALGR